MNQKIKTISNLIPKANVVIDVGCDHCLLAIDLLKNKKVKTVINVDINEQPLAAGINHLKKIKLLNQTINLVNDGLKKLDLTHPLFKNIKVIDYCVIAGMGSNNIISILESNQLLIDTFILHTTKDEYQLRDFLVKNKYLIVNEYYVEEKQFFYPIFVVKKTDLKISYDEEELYFGKINNVLNQDVYLKMLKQRLNFLNTHYAKRIDLIKPKLKQEYLLLKRRISKYEDE